MCDCDDEINISSIPVGPAGPTGPTGPQGPTGPSVVLGGTTGTSLTTGLGPQTMVLAADASFVLGQRVSVTSVDGTKMMSGLIDAYSTGTDILEMTVDFFTGAGIDNDWIVVATGERGATGAAGAAGAGGAAGATGAAAFTTIDTNAVPLGGTSYRIPLVDSAVAIDDMILFVEDAGYYQITDASGGGVPENVIVTDLLYTGNVAANLLAGKKVSPSGIKGDAGTNGTDGFNYETVDANNIPAEASGSYQFLMRNETDTGYTFISLAELKVLLNSIP